MMANSAAFLSAFLFLTLQQSGGTVLLRKNGMSFEFKSKEASFAPRVAGSGVCGYLISGDPLPGCSSLQVKAKIPEGSCTSFVLLVRGNCSFNRKIHKAQDAGFAAVVVFNDDDGSELLTMSGDSEGVVVYAVFISKASGEMLLQYANDSDSECWILPTNENAIWSVLIITFISLLAIATVLATCYIIRRQRFRHMRRPVRERKSCGVSSVLVKAMPTVIFKNANDENITEVVCPICLENYFEGDELKILPCSHQFHSLCIDSWLTMWQPFCPLCKQDVRAEQNRTVPSETTPLLSSASRSNFVPYTFVAQDERTSLGESLSIQTGTHSRNSFPRDGISNCYPHITCISRQLSQCPRSHIADTQSATSYSSCHQSLGSTTYHVVDTNSLEAFRASPYFTSPSMTRNASPQSPGFLPSPYLVDSYQGEDYLNLQEETYSIPESSHGSYEMQIEPWNNSSEECPASPYSIPTSLTGDGAPEIRSFPSSPDAVILYEGCPTLNLQDWGHTMDGLNHESPEWESRRCSSESFPDYAYSGAVSDQEILFEEF